VEVVEPREDAPPSNGLSWLIRRTSRERADKASAVSTGEAATADDAKARERSVSPPPDAEATTAAAGAAGVASVAGRTSPDEVSPIGGGGSGADASGTSGGGGGGAGAGNAETHSTLRLVEELAPCGGPALCLPFLQLGSAPRAAAMRIVLALLLSDDAASAHFCEAQSGFSVVLHLLSTRLQPPQLQTPMQQQQQQPPAATVAATTTSTAVATAGGASDAPMDASWGRAPWGEDEPSFELVELLLETVDRGARSSPPSAPLPPPSVSWFAGSVGSVSSMAAFAANHPASADASGDGGEPWQPIWLSSHALTLLLDLLPSMRRGVQRRALEMLRDRLTRTVEYHPAFEANHAAQPASSASPRSSRSSFRGSPPREEQRWCLARSRRIGLGT